MRIVLISCVAKKRDSQCQAKDMYISPLFKYAYKYANEKLCADKIFILSAKYGLLEESTVIEPYNVTLNNMHKQDIFEWSNAVFSELKKYTNPDTDEFIFLAGENYRQFLISKLKNVKIPLKGLSIGRQLSFYKENT